MQNYSDSNKVASPPAPPRWKAKHSADAVLVQLVNLRRARQHRGPHFIRVDLVVGPVIIFDLLASPAGIWWQHKNGSPVAGILDEALRRRVEQALREAARLENAQYQSAADGGEATAA